MASLRAFLYIYVLGGITFIPLCIGLLFLFAYFTLPEPKQDADSAAKKLNDLGRDGDETVVLKTGTDDLAEKFLRKHESDVAAGYFAVCREYVPSGVNGKPPDKLSPAGEVVATESPSVYQTMYRSIFERTQKPTIEPNKDASGRMVKRGNNVFYVVLRHGHLMLYDDIQQLEVRYVISLDYHDVDIYGGGDTIPEPELWIKRNAIRLTRKQEAFGATSSSLPFFLFSENLSEKEDFYFAILQNMQKSIGDDAPIPQEFEVQHIITLVQRLHSSEEQLQTRWLNAMIGRWFLAMYKTPQLEAVIRQKLTKKIARVKKPNFITKLALQKIDFGTGAPFITNPRLKDLTVNGDCMVEADVNYSGNFRIEIAATVRIDLGARLKAREVDLVLAATCKTLEGHVLVRFKPPPSNRIWITFEKVPKIELALEPIVSSRQITYGVILRSIESRIIEVIAETIVLPFWDDFSFLDTSEERFRGGTWKKEKQVVPTTEIKDEVAEDEAEAGGEGTKTPEPLGPDDRTLSMPVLSDSKRNSALAAARKSVTSLREVIGSEVPKTPEKSSTPREGPRILRSSSFVASGADPMISPSHAPAESPMLGSEAASRRDTMLKDISLRSLGTSPESGQETLPTENPSIFEPQHTRTPSTMSKTPTDAEFQLPRNDSDESQNAPPGLVLPSRSTESLSLKQSLQEDIKQKGFAATAKSLTAADRQKAIASITAATTAAQKWGWGVMARNRQREADAKAAAEQEMKVDKSQPMGRGQPLPPPGVPLPRPAKASMFSMPKRSPGLPPPFPHDKTPSNGTNTPGESPPKPPLPERRRRQSAMQNREEQDDELLIVAAPDESAPSSPLKLREEHHDDFFGHGEDDDEKKEVEERINPVPPPLPSRPDTDHGQD